MSEQNKNNKSNKNGDLNGVLSSLLGSLVPKTRAYEVGDAVWFWGTPCKNNPNKLKRCDIHSDTRFEGKIVAVTPGSFYSVLDFKTRTVFQRPFVDTDLYSMNDQEKTARSERFCQTTTNIPLYNPDIS
jgi:hypothetical protein